MPASASDKTSIKALIIGDVIGQPGCRAVFFSLPQLIKSLSPDLVVVNGENAADGFGITEEIATKIFAAGAHVITTGNHIWQKQDSYPYMDSEPRLLRPLNYPPGVPGHGSFELQLAGTSILVANLQGRAQLPSTDCPFRATDELLRRSKAAVKIVDFHAELTAEKEAFALDFDGRLTAVLGTHTHVTTADERVLPRGTAYITDMGASGPRHSVIGFDPAISVRRSLTQLPLRNEVLDAPAVLHGVLVHADTKTGHAQAIERITHASML